MVKTKKAKKPKKKRPEKIDGISAKDVDRLRQACRKVWSWSHPRKICIARATDKKGFGRCEMCKKRVPKLFADHIDAVGNPLDGEFFKRLFSPSRFLQALCKKCHDKKTNQERVDLAYRRALGEIL